METGLSVAVLERGETMPTRTPSGCSSQALGRHDTCFVCVLENWAVHPLEFVVLIADSFKGEEEST